MRMPGRSPTWALASLFTRGEDAIDTVPSELRMVVARRVKEDNEFEALRSRAGGPAAGGRVSGGGAPTGRGGAATEAIADDAAGDPGRGRRRGRGGGRGRQRGLPPTPPT